MISWVYLRFYTFIYLVLYKFAMGGRLAVDNNTGASPIIAILLITLLGLNIYWFMLLINMAIRLATKGKAQDLQNVVTQKEIEVS